MNASFEIYAAQDEFEGALLYKLQRYVESDDQCNMDTLTTETSENEAKYIQMFVSWKVEDSKPFAYVVLLEHGKEFIWNKDELRKLYNMNYSYLMTHNSTKSYTWLVDDSVVLETMFKVRISEGNFELSISISEGKKVICPARPLHVDLKR
jgi:hypothetical protein